LATASALRVYHFGWFSGASVIILTLPFKISEE
jgi:hypothetical protein